jgi:hypothetical protein
LEHSEERHIQYYADAYMHFWYVWINRINGSPKVAHVVDDTLTITPFALYGLTSEWVTALTASFEVFLVDVSNNVVRFDEMGNTEKNASIVPCGFPIGAAVPKESSSSSSRTVTVPRTGDGGKGAAANKDKMTKEEKLKSFFCMVDLPISLGVTSNGAKACTGKCKYPHIKTLTPPPDREEIKRRASNFYRNNIPLAEKIAAAVDTATFLHN